ncbi:hypothetical protein LX36DRAFT_24534 [Colletotrichum falcatum]|nr:hypothetical protein LX36DRAFT_24534 [Colletotrichum falcatum]
MAGDSSSSSSPSSSSSSSPQNNPTLSRIRSIASHIMAPVAATSFPADTVPQAPEDPLFGLMAAYRADESKDKVDLGIGAYRDDTAKPWVLPVVKKVRCLLLVLQNPIVAPSLLPLLLPPQPLPQPAFFVAS